MDTFSHTSILHLLVEKGIACQKIDFLFGITACNCLKINIFRLLQDKEITVRHDCDQSERVAAEHSSPVG